MRVSAFLVACALVASSAPVSGAPGAPTSSREDSLVALCRLWNAVRFMHPGLASETDARWDDALLAAEPIVERDPAALREAAGAMLASLHDPLTTLDVERKDGPVATPAVEEADGVRVVRMNGFPAANSTAAYAKTLGDALTIPAADRGLAVDLRTPAPPSFDQLDALQSAWSSAPFIARVSTVPVDMPHLAQRYFIGFPSEDAAPNGGYREGRETTSASRTVTPAGDARAVRVAFVTAADAVVPEEALALVRNGDAAMFSADGNGGILPGDLQLLDAGSGLKAALRVSAALDAPPVRRGGYEAALAWIRDPKPDKPPFATLPALRPIDVRYASTALPDEAHRVLASFRMWGTIAYLFPYKNLMHDDWDGALRSALADLHAATTSLDYELALAKMYAHIHDTHGFLNLPATANAYAVTPAFVARDVEGQPTIVRVDPAAAKRDGFAVGDVIEAVDGEPVAARIRRLRAYVAASSEQSMHEILDTRTGGIGLFAGPRGSTARLRLRGKDGRVRDVSAPRAGEQLKLRDRTRPAVDVLPGNVGYVDLGRLQAGAVDSTLKRLSSTRALIFDLRGYPRGTAWAIAPHFIDAPVRAALFRTPVRRVAIGAPGSEQYAEFADETRDFFQLIAPKAPRLRNPVVVVIDARAISQAEHTGLYLAAAAHARFVGEPSMGANGDVTRFFLPGGISANFSGQAVLHPDGSQLQRVGLVPDVHVSPTLRGIRGGDDELLAAGLREALRLAHADAARVAEALAQERRREHADTLEQRLAPAPAPPVAADAPQLPDAFVSKSDGYEGGHDSAVRHRDGRTIVLRAKPDAAPNAFGTLIQTIPVEQYRGKRVRVSGVLRSEGVTAGAFWLRVDGPNGTIQAFDNMGDRALNGTRDWTPFQIVLDVPQDALKLVGGLLLEAPGILWADDLRIETVDPRVPATGSL